MKNEPLLIGGIGEKKSNNNTQWYQQDRIYDNEIAISITTAFNPYYIESMRGGYDLMNENTSNLRIRKLTPRECGRLMGIKDSDIDLIMENQTNASGYHLFGDSIVTTCLMAIFGKLIDTDYKDKFKPGEWWKNGQ